MIYLLFFLSGAAALACQVVWVRSLTLVLGGSHLAVTAVLSAVMGGMAVGGYAIGRRADRVRSPLRLFGLLQLGFAASTLVFEGLMLIYPSLYSALARGIGDAPLFLTLVRLLFAAIALVGPTVLIGGTLPVVSRGVGRGPGSLRRHLPFLYGVNTLGSIAGALVAGFVLLRFYSASTTLHLAVALSAVVGLAALALGARAETRVAPEAVETPSPAPGVEAAPALPVALFLWGIGVSGFCALGYEVLWTRVLAIAVGASVYGFTVILVAFLAGIALGSGGYGVVVRLFGRAEADARKLTAWFGVTQVAIGVLALVVTFSLREVPANAVRLHNLLVGGTGESFQARMWAGFLLAFFYTLVPALFMGAAFPLAGEALARQRKSVGRAVGDLLGSNTLGAVLGSTVSGLVLIRLFGIERSLEMLTIVNVGLGLLVLARLGKRSWLPAGVGAASGAAILALALSPAAVKAWDDRLFAVYRSNQPEGFSTPDTIREVVDNTDVVYYAEGAGSTVSAVKVKGGELAFFTDGLAEASTEPQARQNQLALGHLPVLLCRAPKRVLVVGLGSGMTAGAAAAHPEVERVTVAEIEPAVIGAARAFRAYNHGVLDNPKLGVVIEDGRNFLMTTNERFDVITSDPSHPWFRGASSLYTSEYFALAKGRLRQGGVMAQRLPLYELRPQDLASIVRTFQRQFAHVMLWRVHYDAVMVGSDSPFAIDAAEIERRMTDPAVGGDLAQVEMGTAADLLGYFAMGTQGTAQFAESGVINTDDRDFLEFSAPLSIAMPSLVAVNVQALAPFRESIVPYLRPAGGPADRQIQRERWALQAEAGRAGDRVLALYLGLGPGDPQLAPALGQLTQQFPGYAPGRFLRAEYQAAMALEPRLLRQVSLTLAAEDGTTTIVDMAAVLVPVSRTRASVMFVDSRARVVYGQLYVDDYERTGFAERFAVEVMASVHAAYQNEAAAARARKQALPPAAETLGKLKSVIGSKVQSVKPGS